MKQPNVSTDFGLIDQKLERIKQLTSYDPLMSIVKERFWVEITHHLTSLKAHRQKTPDEVIHRQLENISKPNHDASGQVLKEAYLTLGKEHAVTRFLFDMAGRKMSSSAILMLSELLFGETGLRVDEASFRNVNGEQRQPIKAENIPQALSDLVKWYNDQLRSKRVHPLVLVSQFHHQITVIHPFSEWNGRIARLVLNLALMQQGYLPLLISSDDRLTYYECLSKADSGDVNPLIYFVVSKELSTVNDFMNSPEYMSIEAKYELEKQVEHVGGTEKCFVLTEDSATDNLIGNILEASGFNMNETNIISYEGCSKIGSANLFSIFVKEKMPHVKIIVHRDRDYLTDAEINQQRDTFKRIDTHLFVTAGTDIESCFLDAQHLVYCHPKLHVNQAKKLIADAIAEVYPKSVDYLRKKEFGGGKSEKYTHLNKAIEELVQKNPMRFTHGKTTLKVLDALLREDLHQRPDILRPSPYLRVPELVAIAEEIWR
jgi:hypothetical protein